MGWQFMFVILATQEAEIKKTEFLSQPQENSSETLSQKTHHRIKKGWWSGSRCRS
jgi:hypothetical protein